MIKSVQDFDVYQLVNVRKSIIGNEHIPFVKWLHGHSNFDVLLHVISDSILGALGLGDIGKHFPNINILLKSINSREILKK